MSEALTLLLRAGCDALPVVDADGRPVGQADINTVRGQLRRMEI
jgi:hypothetical protein